MIPERPTSDRPLSAVCSAMLHSIAGGDPDILARLRDYVNDPEDKVADRWQYLRCAERDAWAAVGLLLLRKTLERRFREGELDAWVALTLFGDDIRNGVESLSRSYGSLEFPVEPKGFGAFALRSSRNDPASEIDQSAHEAPRRPRSGRKSRGRGNVGTSRPVASQYARRGCRRSGADQDDGATRRCPKQPMGLVQRLANVGTRNHRAFR